MMSMTYNKWLPTSRYRRTTSCWKPLTARFIFFFSKQLDGLDWNKDVQGGMLGAFYYGFCVTQVFGGWISDRIAGSKAM